MAKVVVVGGGVIGCAVADRLTRDGHQVTLCERDRVGAHASGAAAGLLAPYSESGPAGPFLELAVKSYRLFGDLAARLRSETGIEVEHREGEGLALAFSASEVKTARELAERHPPGSGARYLEPEECRRLEPGLSAEVAGAALIPQAEVNPRRLVRGLAWAAAAGGARVLEGTPAISLIAAGGRIRGVRLAGGRIEADWVVIAAGPWSPGLALTAGVELPIAPRRGQLIALASPGPVLGRILTHGHHYLVPKPDGSLIAGSTEEEVGFAAEPTAQGAALLLGFAQRAVPGLAGAVVERVWAALRPSSPTEMPLIGPAGPFPNLVVAAGHHRNGILLAPVTAELVGEGIAGGWPPA